VRVEIRGAGGQAHQIQQFVHAPAPGRGVDPLVDHQRLGDDGAHPHPRIERRVRILEHRLHRASVALPAGPTERQHVLAAEADGPRGRPLETEHELRGGGLPAAGLADHAESGAHVDAERDRIDRAHQPGGPPQQPAAHRKVLGEPLHLEQGAHPDAPGDVSSQQRVT
jgi:hypothetical protein